MSFDLYLVNEEGHALLKKLRRERLTDREKTILKGVEQELRELLQLDEN